MKNIYLLLLIVLITGCTRKFTYDFPTDSQSLKNMSLNDYFHKISATEPITDSISEIIFYNDPKSQYLGINGINRSELYCQAKNGKFSTLDVESRTFINDKMDIYILNKSYVCKINDEPYFLIYSGQDAYTRPYSYIDISQQSLEKYRNLKQIQDKITKKYEEDRKQAEITKKLEKTKKEQELMNNIHYLKSRKGLTEFIIYDSYEYSYNEQGCSDSCLELSLNNCGYSNLQDALDDKWQFVSYLGDTKKNINSSCICKGRKIILKK